MCSQGHPHFKPLLNSKDLSLDEFKHILIQFPGARHVSLQGLGEPLLNPDLFGIIEHTRRSKKTASLTTNGSLLTEETSKRLLESGLTRMSISIDAVTKETYEKIRPGADFDLLLKNIERLVRLNEQKKDPITILCRTVIINENLEEIPKFPDFLQALGIKNVFFTEVATIPVEPITPKPPHDTVKRILDELKETTKNAEFSVITLSDFSFKKVPCSWLWGAAYITAEGYFTPCCLQPFPLLFPLGNVFKDDFRKIWNSSIYKQARKMMKKHPLDLCRRNNCPFLDVWEDMKEPGHDMKGSKNFWRKHAIKTWK